MIILQDSKEKTPWDFSIYGVETVKGSLRFGDYTVKELYDKEEDTGIIRIERKSHPTELANNIGAQWRRFQKEMVEMSKCKEAYLILEFDAMYLSHFPNNLNLNPKILKNIKVTSQFIFSKLKHIEENYGVEVIFCNDRNEAQDIAWGILKNAAEKFA